jgi:hypothetical protein
MGGAFSKTLAASKFVPVKKNVIYEKIVSFFQ